MGVGMDNVNLITCTVLPGVGATRWVARPHGQSVADRWRRCQEPADQGWRPAGSPLQYSVTGPMETNSVFPHEK